MEWRSPCLAAVISLTALNPHLFHSHSESVVPNARCEASVIFCSIAGAFEGGELDATVGLEPYLFFSGPSAPLVASLPAESLADYVFLRILSAGTISVVYLVREKSTCNLYALKVIDKRARDITSVYTEQAALTRLSGCSFVLPLHTSFHDTKYWYLLTAYLPGGDLMSLRTLYSIDMRAVQFYMAEILLAIEHIHRHNIIHGAIEERNVFIDIDGHIVLGDFGDSTTWLYNEVGTGNSFMRGRVVTLDFSSRDTYRDHEYNSSRADLQAFGGMLYEMLSGKEVSEYDRDIHDIENTSMPEDAADLVDQLLRKDLFDFTQIKKHHFFGGIDWAIVASRSLTPPWVPYLISTHDFPIRLQYQTPYIISGEPHTARDDPHPRFTFHISSSSISRTCGLRTKAFEALQGYAPLVMWDEIPSGVEEEDCLAPHSEGACKGCPDGQ